MPIFPGDVTPGQLRAFLKSVRESGGLIHIDKVAMDLNWDLTKILPILDVAEMLGLIVVEKGEAKLSGEGERLLKIERGKMRELSGLLSHIEPFQTALSCSRKFTGEEVAKRLSERGIRWYHEDEINALIISDILIQWGIRAGILDYDGSGFMRAAGSQPTISPTNASGEK